MQPNAVAGASAPGGICVSGWGLPLSRDTREQFGVSSDGSGAGGKSSIPTKVGFKDALHTHINMLLESQKIN